jgi:predicted lipid-binding transport protein (Tim44 family)
VKDGIKIVAAILAAIIFIALISWAGWAISVATSGPKGQGDAIKTKNSAANWTAAQARFEEQHQAIISADEKIAVHAAALAASPSDRTLQTNLTGVTTACISAVADYNAESRKYLSEDFKSADLPYQIDKTDPATDCK